MIDLAVGYYCTTSSRRGAGGKGGGRGFVRWRGEIMRRTRTAKVAWNGETE